MTISNSAIRPLRTWGTAALWLGGWAGVFPFAALLGSGFTITGFNTVVIVISSVLLAATRACRVAEFAGDADHDNDIRHATGLVTRSDSDPAHGVSTPQSMSAPGTAAG